MGPIDIIAIQQEARRLRAEEMRRLEGICVAYLARNLRVLGARLLAAGKIAGEALRPHHKARLS